MHTRACGCCTGLAPTCPGSSACWLRVPPYGLWVTFHLDPGHNLLPGLAQNGSTQPLDTFAIIKVSVLCTGKSEIVSRVEFRSSGAAAAAAAAVLSTGQNVLGRRSWPWGFEFSRLCKLCFYFLFIYLLLLFFLV